MIPILPIVITVVTENDLNTAFATANAATSGTFDVDIKNNLQFSSDKIQIALKPGVSMVINGEHNVIDGANAHRGLFVYSGTVKIENLTIQHAAAPGQAGGAGRGSGGGGGGGAGLGGGLFIAAAGNVTVDNVAFQGNAAIGGSGGSGGGFGSGGGGGAGGAGVIGQFGAGGGGAIDSAHLGAPGAWGGGGGAGSGGGTAGLGGYGGGNGVAGGGGNPGGSAGTGGGGGGGLGAGGDIFVQAGGRLNIAASSLGAAATVIGGAGGPGFGGVVGRPGHGFGASIFIEGTRTISLGGGQLAGHGTAIYGAIADQTGAYLAAGLKAPRGKSADGTPNAGSGGLAIHGLGVVALGAADPFTGGTAIYSGTLELGAPGAAGTGKITFAGASVRLTIDPAAQLPGATFPNVLQNVHLGSVIDLAGLAYTGNAPYSTLTLNAGTLSVTESGKTEIFALGAPGQSVFYAASDGAGGTLILTTPP
jgi:hypothetical protein